LRLHHVRLLVSDVGASITFYRDVLGFDLKWGEASIGYASFAGGNGVDLSVFHRSGQPDATATHSGDALLLSLEVEDVDRELERLRSRGAVVAAEPRDEDGWGIRVAYVRDPDGNLLELMQQLSADQWSAWLRAANARYS
jgi:lactoylglutathione lyase